MNQKNKVLEQYGIWFADLVCIVAVFIAATYIRFGNFVDMGDRSAHFNVCLSFILFCTIYSFFIAWNTDFADRGIYRELVVVTKYNALMLLVVELVMYFFKWADVFSRLVMVYFVIGNTIVTWLVHLLIRKFLKLYYQFDLTSIKVLVVGEKNNLEEILKDFKHHLDFHYEIIGCVAMDENLEEESIEGIPVIAQKETLLEQSRLIALDEVFICLPSISGKEMAKLIRNFDEMGIVCHRKLDTGFSEIAPKKVEDFGSYKVLSYVRFQSSYKKLLLKRLMDIAGALVGLLITAIITPFVVLAIKIDDPGPAFFAQTRVGRNGRRFKIYKFRSMYMDAEERKKELMAQNEIKGLMFKMDNDPRITKVGKFIRKTSIDELPQFWNILIGDMSLVGTRPPTEDEFDAYNQHYRRRLFMTPGLTGMWQVSGRSSIEDFDEVVKLDLKYIDNWTISLDIKILLQTVLVVFTGRGSK